MGQIQFFKFESSKNKGKRALQWIFECIAPCLLIFVLFNYVSYDLVIRIIEESHIKGFDLSTSLDDKIPLVAPLIFFYAPSVITWAIMPFVVYGLYGRNAFWKLFAANLVISIIYFIVYIVFPTQAILQYNEVAGGMYVNNPDLSFSEKMVAKIYQTAAPYGEMPSGHCIESYIFILAIFKPKQQTDKKYGKAQWIVFSIWTAFSVIVVASTFLLKQHNFTDWIATIPVMLIVWWWMGFSKLPNVLRKWFTLLNIKLGVQQATGNIHALSYDAKKPSKYYWKLVTLWIISMLIVIYLIIIVWNHTLGGFLGAKVPYLVPTYIQPTYDSDDSGIKLPGYDTWKEYWF